jgi:hypothetical protein
MVIVRPRMPVPGGLLVAAFVNQALNLCRLNEDSAADSNTPNLPSLQIRSDGPGAYSPDFSSFLG